MKRFFAPILLLVSILVMGAVPGCITPITGLVSRSYNLINGTITVSPGTYYSVSFPVDMNAMRNVWVDGSFTAAGGSGNDIEVHIMDDIAYTNWVNGHTVSVIYSSGKVTTANIDVPITMSGNYYLVFSNRFSMVSSKNVATKVDLKWSEL
jgi:hypothetical protein